jgi:hypothetical protein
LFCALLSAFQLLFLLPLSSFQPLSKMSSNKMFAANDKQLNVGELISFIKRVMKSDPKYVDQPVTYPGIHGVRLEAYYLELHAKAGLIVTSEPPVFPIPDGDEHPIKLQSKSALTVGQLLQFLQGADETAPVSSLVFCNVDIEPSRILTDHVCWGLCISPY